MSAFRTAALDNAAAGIPVFPCAPRGKAPLTPHGFKDAATGEATITRWWTRYPQANIAIPTGAGTYDVLDVDVRSAGNGWAAFHRLNAAGLLSGALRLVRTPSSGIHLYFPGTSQPCGSLPDHHLDLKATGGYVLLPPSYVVTDDYDGTYTVESDYSTDSTGEPLDWQACRALLAPPREAPVRPHASPPGDIGALATWLRKQGEGTRNKGLYWAARRALEQGCPDPAPLMEAALAGGLTEIEARRTIASAVRGGVK